MEKRPLKAFEAPTEAPTEGLSCKRPTRSSKFCNLRAPREVRPHRRCPALQLGRHRRLPVHASLCMVAEERFLPELVDVDEDGAGPQQGATRRGRSIGSQ